MKALSNSFSLRVVGADAWMVMVLLRDLNVEQMMNAVLLCHRRPAKNPKTRRFPRWEIG